MRLDVTHAHQRDCPLPLSSVPEGEAALREGPARSLRISLRCHSAKAFRAASASEPNRPTG